MLFRIDLLRGQALPVRSRPKMAAIIAIGLAAPIIAVTFLLGTYLNSSLVISAHRKGINEYQAMINDLSNSLGVRQSVQNCKEVVGKTLAEVSMAVKRYDSWSPVLETLARKIPDSLVLAALEVRQRPFRSQIVKPANPQQKMDVSVPARVLEVHVTGGNTNGCEEALRQLTTSLKQSQALASRLEDIRISRGYRNFEGRKAVYYQVDCLFEPGL